MFEHVLRSILVFKDSAFLLASQKVTYNLYYIVLLKSCMFTNNNSFFNSHVFRNVGLLHSYVFKDHNIMLMAIQVF